MTEQDEEYERLLAEDEEEEICGRTISFDTLDPCMVTCELAPGHGGRHSGPDPFGGEGRVSWMGGGSVAGDPLPVRDIRYTE